MKPLFQPTVRKTAQAIGGRLPTNTAEWPIKIRDEWAKAAPFASGFPAEIVLLEKDPDKGYAFGHILLSSKTGLPMPQAIGQIGTEYGIRTAKVPVIIEDFAIQPLDLIVTEEGTALPLNEDRLRETLFRPGLFDAPTKGSENELFGAVLYPPMREANTVKSSAFYPILTGVSDTIEVDQVRRLESALKTAGIERAARNNPGFRGYLSIVNGIDARQNISKTAMLDSFLPDVVLAERMEGPAYKVKTAMRGAYDPRERVVDRGEAIQLLGMDGVKEADAKGVVIIIRRKRPSVEPLIMDDLPGSFGSLGEDGPCRVLSSNGESLVGRILSKVKSLMGGDLPLQLFSDGDRFGMRDAIGAAPVATNVELRTSHPPQGVGAFCWESDDGRVCTEPLRAMAQARDDNRPAYLCETLAGRELKVVPSAMTKDVTPSDDDTVLIPKDSSWVHLGDRMVELASPGEANAIEHVKEGADRCTIAFSNDQFHISGTPLAKLGNLKALSPTDAVFMCGLMGLSKQSAERALARAYRKGSVKVAGVPEIKTYEEAQSVVKETIAETMKEAAALELPFLVKEASTMGDAQSVDAILSLGFLNLDNVSRFVTYIPHVDSTVKKLCMLLLAARLGLREMPQDHLSRAISALEHILGGLRRVALRLSPVNSALA